jgi:MoaA/NifB/PqqE/SkfB family radical SAM enzyme
VGSPTGFGDVHFVSTASSRYIGRWLTLALALLLKIGIAAAGLLERIKRYLPATAVHVLSNGRRFADIEFARSYAHVGHPDLIGIPLNSGDPARHNYVVQAGNAFGETVRGILNLKRFKQRVELRVVIHRQTIDRLPQLAEYIGRNLLFVDQVALMGLEITGFTKGNLGQL